MARYGVTRFLLNGGMVFVGVLLVVALLAGTAVWAFRRRGSDELHSVAGYQHRLERLEEVRRRQGGAVRIVGGPGQGLRDEPIQDDDGRIEISSSSSSARRRAFEDAGPPPPGGPRRPPPPYRRGRYDHSISRMSHRPRRLGAPIAAASAVIVLVIVLAILGAHANPSKPSTAGQTHNGTHHHGTPTTTTTSTTAPPRFVAASVSAPDATYSLPYPSYTLSIQGTGSGGSWVQITEANGTVPYASVLAAGQSQQFTLTGNSQVELGRSTDATVSIDRTPVTFPSPLPDPLVLVFNTPQSNTTTTTTTTTTSPAG